MIIEIGLRLQKVVKIVLPAQGVPFPAASAEDGEPVVRWRPVRLRVFPDVPVRLRVCPVSPGLDEPRMPVGGVAEDLIDDDADVPPVRRFEHGVEGFHAAEEGVDVLVVGNVVAEVVHGRGVDGREPESIDAEVCEIGHLFRDAEKVADAVAVRVAEAARIDLVKNRSAPPFGLLLHACFL